MFIKAVELTLAASADFSVASLWPITALRLLMPTIEAMMPTATSAQFDHVGGANASRQSYAFGSGFQRTVPVCGWRISLEAGADGDGGSCGVDLLSGLLLSG